MMTKFISYTRKLLVRTLSLAALLCMTSCEKFFDYEGDCDPHYFVSFIYDMNIKGGDAFSSQVSSVDLYVFDASTGRFVAHYAEAGDPLKQPGYLMPVDLTPGSYEFLAWCGLANNEGRFNVPSPGQISSIADLKAVMSRQYENGNSAFSNTNLDYNSNGEPCALYHGMIDATLPAEQGTYVYPIHLTKDTNNLIVSIWHRYGDLDPDTYEIKMVYDGESNLTMGHDNAVLADEDVTYRPWMQTGGDLDLGDSPDGKYIKCEISLSRLIDGHSPRIYIYDTVAGEKRLEIDFLRYVKAMHSEVYRQKWGYQEYLDREDEYSMNIILDSTWAGFQIVINGWHVIENDSQL